MRRDEFFQRHRRKNVTVVDQQRLVAHPRLDVFQPAARLQQDRLVKQRHLITRAEIVPRLGQVMRVDRKPPDPDLRTSRDRPLRQRSVE